ncbi:hypothetical protein CAP39_12320 [Sphingomonas sp. IBVSS1]|nr:hypothetical protein CAP39_12320 [Sphingomonas sp. IBVSS1]
MFIGHFAASVAVKTVRPQLPFWACVGAAQLMDIGWAVLIWAGVEKLRVVPGLPGSPLDLYHMPYTHSLLAAILWSLAAAAVAARWYGVTALWLGVAVFSHWVADFVVHRPDLLLWPGGTLKLGLGLWNLPVLEMLVEAGLLGLAVAWWVGLRVAAGQAARPALGWFFGLLVLGAVNAVPGEPPSPAGMAALALLGFGLAIGLGWLVDRADRRT